MRLDCPGTQCALGPLLFVQIQDICNLLVERFNEGVEMVKFRTGKEDDPSNANPDQLLEMDKVSLLLTSFS